MPAQDRIGGDEPARPKPCRQEADQRSEDCVVGPVEPGQRMGIAQHRDPVARREKLCVLGGCRPAAKQTSHPQSRTKLRQCRHKDKNDHDALRLMLITAAHRPRKLLAPHSCYPGCKRHESDIAQVVPSRTRPRREGQKRQRREVAAGSGLQPAVCVADSPQVIRPRRGKERAKRTVTCRGRRPSHDPGLQGLKGAVGTVDLSRGAVSDPSVWLEVLSEGARLRSASLMQASLGRRSRSWRRHRPGIGQAGWRIWRRPGSGAPGAVSPGVFGGKRAMAVGIPVIREVAEATCRTGGKSNQMTR